MTIATAASVIFLFVLKHLLREVEAGLHQEVKFSAGTMPGSFGSHGAVI